MFKPILQVGTRNKEVGDLKSVLKTLEYSVSDDSDSYDMKTRNAVEAFQNDYGLRVDGIVNEKTWQALENAYTRRGGVFQTASEEHIIEENNDCETQSVEANGVEEQASAEIDAAQPTEAITEIKAAEEIELVAENIEAAAKSEYIEKDNGIEIVTISEYIEDAVEIAAVEKAAGYKNIKKGSTGSFVSVLQKKLKFLGYLHGDYKEGTFCKRTDSAVRAFQRENGVRDNGVACANTWGLLFAQYHKKNGVQTKPIIKKGSQGDYVCELQIKLCILRFYGGDIDCVFGERTERSVREFQDVMGIYVDGVAGEDTWALLDNIFASFANAKAIGIQARANPVTIDETELVYVTGSGGKTSAPAAKTVEASDAETTNLKPTLKEGMDGDFVFYLQQRLNELDYLIKGIDGHFGAKTKSAVRAFQRDNSLKADGIVGKETWRALDKAIQKPVAKELIPPEKRPVLKERASGDWVSFLQNSLIDKGFLTGVSDGIFGAKTAKAVTTFQKAANLQPDGIVGEKTWRALDGYSPSAKPEPPPAPSTAQFVPDIDNAPEFTALMPEHNKYTPNVPHKPAQPRTPLSIGSEGPEVFEIQQKLNQLGLLKKFPNGVFDSVTDYALRKFQESVKLAANGICDEMTWNAFDQIGLYSASEMLMEAENRPSIEHVALKHGASGEMVTILQIKLKMLGFFPYSITGSFGNESTSAVEAFQKAYGLPCDGVVDSVTWLKLYELTDNYVPPSELEQSHPNVKPGDSGEHVAALQNILTILQFYNEPVTGQFDTETLVAVKSFQDVNGLMPTGHADEATWYLLELQSSARRKP